MLDINSRRTLTAIIYLSVIGPCVFILQPGFVQGLVEQLRLSEQQAGYVASAEMWGIAATTVALVFTAGRYSWRRITVACLLLSGLGNFACIGQTDPFALMVLRFAVGLGSGGIISLTFTMAGLTARSDRNFGYIIVWVLSYGAAGLVLMPAAYAHIGMAGVLVIFGLFCLSGLAFVRALPDSGEAHADTRRRYDYEAWLRIATLVAVLLYNLGIGIVWTYLFLVGTQAGMPEQNVANVLTVSQVLGIAGAFCAVLFETRFGRLLPLAIGILGGAASVYLLLGTVTSREYWLGVCGFNLLWNVTMPYYLATAGDFDARKQTVVYAVAMQMLGLAGGPLLAAWLLAHGGYNVVNGTAILVLIASAIAFVPGVIAQLRRHRKITIDAA
jgi:MFS family permease